MPKKQEAVQEPIQQALPEIDVPDVPLSTLNSGQSDETSHLPPPERVTGELVLRLPAALWEVFGSPEFHRPISLATAPDNDNLVQIVATLRTWRQQVIEPLLAEFIPVANQPASPPPKPALPAGASAGLTTKQISYGRRLAKEAGLSADVAEGTLENMAASEFDDFIASMKTRKEAGPKPVDEFAGIVCPRCGKFQKVPKNWRGSAETFFDLIREQGCYNCRFGK